VAAPSKGITVNTSLKVLAIVVAFVVWGVAISDRSRTSPVLTFDAVIQAPVEAINVAGNVRVVSMPDYVSARLRGPKELESGDLPTVTATCDLAGFGPGKHSVAPVVAAPIPFELVNPPGRILIELEKIDRLALDVEAPPGFSAVPASVELEGPASALAQVDRAVAVSISDSTATVIAVDEHGVAVPGVSAFPGAVTILLVAGYSPPAGSTMLQIGGAIAATAPSGDSVSEQLVLTLDRDSEALR
jgi:hypothetical protein